MATLTEPGTTAPFAGASRAARWPGRCGTMLPSAAAGLLVLGVVMGMQAPVSAESPGRERELSCSDGSTFVGQQVRFGRGKPPSSWRMVADDDSVAFSVHTITVVAPDGSVVESETWHHGEGVGRIHELVTCSLIIPVGPLAGHMAQFQGFFVPVGN